MMDEHDAIDHVDGLHDHFEQEAHAGVARAGDGLEIDDAGDVDQIGRAEHAQGGDGPFPDVRDVGVDADDRLREQGDEQRGHEHERITQADVLEDGGAHGLHLARPDEVAHERAARGAEGGHYHVEEARHAAHDVGNGQRLLAQVFDEEEEEKPRGEGEEALNHRPERHLEDVAQRARTETDAPVQAILLAVDAPPGVDDEEHERHQLAERRADGRARNAQGREAQLAEDEDVVEHHVGQHHHDGIERERLGLRRADVESAKHGRDEGEEEAEDAPVDVALGRGADVRVVDDALEQQGRNPLREGKHHDGEAQEEVDTVVEDGADFLVVLLAVAPRHDDLRAGTEAEAHHEYHHIIYSRDGRSPEFHLAHAPQKSRVGHSDELFHDQAHQTGVGNLPDFLVRINCLHTAFF